MGIVNRNEFFLLEELVKKNFASKYKGSVIGIFWSLLKPLMIMILLTIIFSTIFGNQIENYPVYFLTGKCIFDFFSAGTTSTMLSIKGNENILKKTAPPKHVFVIAGVVSEFINFLITIAILIFVMVVTNIHFNFITIPLSIFPLISLFTMITGIGLILSIFCVYYKDIQHLWGVLILMLMYASAIFYPMDIIPEPFHTYMALNPIFWIIDQVRDLTMYGVIPNYLNLINSMLFSLIILIIGIIIFKIYEHKVTMKF
ncbi:ABC transporter permease [Methanobrevibacter gottschalkii]|uniref:ABC transporter permease n=1 Tax=Methanobrevibacter gottschalkii TaxID=190974 RepID=UPI0038D15450